MLAKSQAVHRPARFIWNVCGKEYLFKCLLDEHGKTKYQGFKIVWSYPGCQYKLSSKAELNRHKNTLVKPTWVHFSGMWQGIYSEISFKLNIKNYTKELNLPSAKYVNRNSFGGLGLNIDQEHPRTPWGHQAWSLKVSQYDLVFNEIMTTVEAFACEGHFNLFESTFPSNMNTKM